MSHAIASSTALASFIGRCNFVIRHIFAKSWILPMLHALSLDETTSSESHAPDIYRLYKISNFPLEANLVLPENIIQGHQDRFHLPHGLGLYLLRPHTSLFTNAQCRNKAIITLSKTLGYTTPAPLTASRTSGISMP